MNEIFTIEKLPQGWTLTAIDNIAEIVMGQSPPSDTYNNEGIGLPFFQGKAEFTELYPTVRKWCSKPNKIALPDDILISVRAPVGATNISNVKCCIGRGLAAIRYTPCHKFLFYYLRLIEKKLDEKGTGTTFRAISGDVIRETPVYLPPLSEQERIVAKIEELFSNLDKGIERLKAAQQQLKIYRQSVLKWAFEGRYTNELHMDQELPNGWKWIKTGDFAFVTKLAGFEFTKYVRYSGSGEIPVIRAQNVSKNGFIKRNFIYVDRKTLEILPRSRVAGGEVLMVFVGAGLGNVAIVPSDIDYFLGPNVAKISFKQEIFNKYAYYFFSSILGFGNISKHQKATAQGSISMSNIREVMLPLPPSQAEQKQIVYVIESRLSICDELEQNINQGLQQAEALRQSILKKAFEGKLVPYESKD